VILRRALIRCKTGGKPLFAIVYTNLTVGIGTGYKIKVYISRMKILTSDDLRAADRYTIEHTPINSLDLMERAATLWALQFAEDYPDTHHKVCVVCGPGNNGGDGLVIARWLAENAYEVEVWLPRISDRCSPEFNANLQRLPDRQGIVLRHIRSEGELPTPDRSSIFIDALFGSGLSRPISGIGARLIELINLTSNCTVAVDMPSGLPADHSPTGPVMKCQRTYTFQVPKLTLLLDEYHELTGDWKILDIGLSEEFIAEIRANHFMLDLPLIKSLYLSRKITGHKGNFGHAGITAGSYGKIGAAMLCGHACLRAGAGLVTLHLPGCGVIPLQTALPEVMLSPDNHDYCVTAIPIDDKYSIRGIGPGLGTNELAAQALGRYLKFARSPVLLDADALNILSQNKDGLAALPERSVLTPHPKEFVRLFGERNTPIEQLELQKKMSMHYGIYIVYKSHYSRVTTPEGLIYFNSTGNDGMATAGSGDVLTGIITGLLAQRYSPLHASLIGMYLHGLAGDIAADKLGHNALIAGDIIDHLGFAFQLIS